MNSQYIQVPVSVVNSPEYKLASSHAKHLLLELALQLKSKQNGDLVLTWSYLKQTGRWRSPVTSFKARNELVQLGLVIKANIGGPHRSQTFSLPEVWLVK